MSVRKIESFSIRGNVQKLKPTTSFVGRDANFERKIPITAGSQTKRKGIVEIQLVPGVDVGSTAVESGAWSRSMSPNLN